MWRALRISLCVAATVGAAATGCAGEPGPDDNPTSIVDTSGVRFDWRCDRERCRLHREQLVPHPDCSAGQRGAIGVFFERFFEVCGACADDQSLFGSEPHYCRAIRCERDADCPQLYGALGVKRYRCQQRLCQLEGAPHPAPDHDLAFKMCIAELPRERTTSDALLSAELQAIYGQLAEHCPLDGECRIPPGCWQPD